MLVYKVRMEEFPVYKHLGTKFEYLVIKDFEFWRLYLHLRQYPYIGRCYAASFRVDAKCVLDMRECERRELFKVVFPVWGRATKKLFGHNPQNADVACFSNEWKHLHWHFIPRFDEVVLYSGYIFKDKNPGANYSPYPKKELPHEFMVQLVADMRDAIR